MDWLNLLLDQAYAAALDSELWRPFSEQLALELASFGGVFIVLDAKRLAPRAFQTVLGMEGIEVDYTEQGWWQFDPQIPRACGLKQSAIYRDSDFQRGQTEEARAYQNWESGWGSTSHLTSVGLLDGAGEIRACFSYHYGNEGLASEAARKLRLLTPELNRALQLGFRHEEALSKEYWRGLASTDDTKALLLLDEHGRVSQLTKAAEAIIRQDDGLRITNRSLRCVQPAQDDRILSLISHAIGPHPASGAIRVARPRSRSPIIVSIFPLPKVRRSLAPFEAAALVHLIDPQKRPRDTRALYRQAFGLSDRETELAALIMSGHSPESAAAVLDIAVPTVRLHLRRLFQKTETGRQSELVRLLGGLEPR